VTALISTALLRTQTDARLVALTRDGHDRAFEAIVERYRRPLHAHCRRLLPHARAEDVVQQTFLSAWSALRDGEDVRDLRAWLHRIAHNTALNALKRAGYDYDELRDSLRPAPGPDDDLERRWIIRETLAGLAALPERQREALLRTAVLGVSGEAVARDLGISDGALRQLVHRARSALRAAASMVVPLPLVARVAAMAADGAPAGSERVGELAAGAGSAGIAGGLLKAGGAVVVAGALATGAATGVPDVARHHGDRASRPAAAEATAAGEAAAAPALEPAAVSDDRRAAVTPVRVRGRRDGAVTRGERRGRSRSRRGRGGGERVVFEPIGRRGPSPASGPISGDHGGSGRDGGGQDRSGRDGGSRSGPDDGLAPLTGTDQSGPGSGSGSGSGDGGGGEALDGGSGDPTPSMSDSSGSGSGSVSGSGSRDGTSGSDSLSGDGGSPTESTTRDGDSGSSGSGG
jgi:RNA polymerase sigma factor (sigma-70 family)